MWSLSSNALRPAGSTFADAAGLPILPGLLNFAQIQHAVRNGQPITHLIRLTARLTADAYIWPADTRQTPAAAPPCHRWASGSRRDSTWRASAERAYCADVKAVLVEMQHYGLILADNGSNWYFGETAYRQWPNHIVSLLKQIPARDFQAVNTSYFTVNPNSQGRQPGRR